METCWPQISGRNFKEEKKNRCYIFCHQQIPGTVCFCKISDSVWMHSILRYSAGRGLPSKACCLLSPPTPATKPVALGLSSALQALHRYLKVKGFCTDVHLPLGPAVLLIHPGHSWYPSRSRC